MRAEYIDFTRNRAATYSLPSSAACGRQLPPRADEGRVYQFHLQPGSHIQSALISRLRAVASPEGEAKETL